VIGPLESGIDPYSPDISCELTGPCFEANALRTEVVENIARYQFHFQYDASGPLGQENSQAKSDLDIVQSSNVVFSSYRFAVAVCNWTDRFTGKPVSATTGLYYEYQRWYDPSIGRFMSQDPIRGGLSNPQSLNPYVYAVNSATTLSDPSGMYVAGMGGPCIDSCGNNVQMDTLAGIAFLITSPELHHFGDPGSFFTPGRDYGICLDCGSVSRETGSEPVTTSENIRDLGTFVNRVEFENPEIGPSSQQLETFNADATRVVDPQDEQVFIYGSRPGYPTPWSTDTLYATSGEARSSLSAPGRNTAKWVGEAMIPGGTVRYVGTAKPLYGGLGGGKQILVANPFIYTNVRWRNLQYILA
jgi:RHS repeat-associated protein